jgi:lipid-A-disaccharide synthase
MNYLTALLALVLVKLYRGFFTMVNIILDKEVFQEFVQYEVTNKNLVPAVEAILVGGSRRAEVEKDMIELRRVLSTDYKPSESAAIAVLDEVCDKN